MMRSYLARLQPKTPISEEELERLRAEAWHRQGIIVIDPKRIANAFDRQILINYANGLWGKRSVEKVET